MARESTVYAVVPDPDGGWDVRKQGAAPASAHYDTKERAVSRAVELARAEDLARVVVHRRDGTVESEETYGNDPREPRR